MSDPYTPPTNSADLATPEDEVAGPDKGFLYRPDLRTPKGLNFGAAGAALFLAAPFLPLFSSGPKSVYLTISLTGDGLLILIAGILGGLWAFLGRQTFQGIACLLGLLTAGGTYVQVQEKNQFLKPLGIGIDFGLGFWAVIAGAICFGVSSAMMKRAPKKRKRGQKISGAA